MTTRRDVLGIDIGGVIIDRVSEDETGAPGLADRFATIPPIAGAFDAIARLVRERFGDRVWLVSRADEASEARIREWLPHREFYRITTVAPERVRFCRERSEKAPICGALGITHFVDDRLEVLSHLVGVVPHLYHFQSRAADLESFRTVLPHVHQVKTWDEVAGALLAGSR